MQRFELYVACNAFSLHRCTFLMHIVSFTFCSLLLGATQQRPSWQPGTRGAPD